LRRRASGADGRYIAFAPNSSGSLIEGLRKITGKIGCAFVVWFWRPPAGELSEADESYLAIGWYVSLRYNPRMRYLVRARVKPGRQAALLQAVDAGTLGEGSVAEDEYLSPGGIARLFLWRMLLPFPNSGLRVPLRIDFILEHCRHAIEPRPLR
jgi:hypothetical protein